MCEIVVNDLFDEIINENNRLCNQLVFAMKCLDVLQTFETFIRKVMTFKTIIINEQQLSSQDIQTLDQLDNQLQEVVTEIPKWKERNKKFIKISDKAEEVVTYINQSITKWRILKKSDIEANILSTDRPIVLKKNLITINESKDINNCEQQTNEINRQIQEKRFPCFVRDCHFNCHQINDFVFHLQSCHAIIRKMCTREGCNQLFSDLRDFEKHVFKCHSNVRKSDCIVVDDSKRKRPKKFEIVDQMSDDSHKLLKEIDFDFESERKKTSQLLYSKKTYSKQKTTDNNYCFNGKQFNCFENDCDFNSEDIDELVDHLKSDHSIDRLRCIEDDCYQLFFDFDDLRKHLSKIHNKFIRNVPQVKLSNIETKDILFDDQVIASKVTKRISLSTSESRPTSTAVIKMSSRRQVFKCQFEDCGKLYISKECLDHHIRNCHEPASDGHQQLSYRSHKIDDSDSTYRLERPEDSYEDENGQIRERVRRYKCPHESCGRGFFTRNNLRNHVLGVHCTERKFVCTVAGCSYRGPTKNYLRQHMKSHTMHPRKPMPTTMLYCQWPGCKYKTVQPCSMSAHKVTHSTERKWPCSWPGCDYRAKRCRDYRMHMTTHTHIDSNVVCDWPECDKRFRTVNAMRLHQIIHKGQLISCEWEGCRYKSIRKDKIKRHVNTVHLKLKRKS
ncbi:zinc finger protein 675-like [Oppia nitens]|uniref:zinc finger protein 675-like n=1 Tax=Oppia nitens TaxID=1686743 RepID=UPI0023DBF1EA|nr:zinc finger protein 675-like [Oppia nitens]